MDRFREASSDLYQRHFDDPFIADRFGWVEDAMFLVMVLNYFDLSQKKPVYPELAFHPQPSAKAAVQGPDSWVVALSESDVLQYRYVYNDDADDPPSRWDGRWLVARVAETSEPRLLGRDVVLAYIDCSFMGSVELQPE